MAALDFHHSNLDLIEKHHSTPVQRLGGYFLLYFENWLAAFEGRGTHVAALLEIASLRGSHRKEVEAQYIALFRRLRQYLRDGIA